MIEFHLVMSVGPSILNVIFSLHANRRSCWEWVHGYSYFGNVSQSPVSDISIAASFTDKQASFTDKQCLCPSCSSLFTLSTGLFDVQSSNILITLMPANAYVKCSVNLKYWNRDRLLLNFLPLTFSFSWLRNPLPNEYCDYECTWNLEYAIKNLY